MGRSFITTSLHQLPSRLPQQHQYPQNSLATAAAAISQSSTSSIMGRPPIAECYNLGPMGYLMAVTPSAEADTPEVKGHITVVLDTSGSMCSWVDLSRRAIQEVAVDQLGYNKNDTFSFIHFSNSSRQVLISGRDPKFGELTTLLDDIRASGSTNMSGAIPLIQKVLYDNKQSSQVILVISDGEVFDQSQTVAEATKVAKSLEDYKNPINACLLRLKTSASANPDTRALASVGSFCNHSKATVTDVDVWAPVWAPQDEACFLRLKNAIAEGLDKALTHRFIELSSEQTSFRRLPTSDPISSVHIPCNGRASYFLVSRVPETVRLGDHEITLEEKGVANPEGSVRAFFEFVEQQLKMWHLMGGRDPEIQNTVQWISQLQLFLDELQDKAANEADISTMGRARALKKTIQKTSGSLLGRIRQVGNTGRVDQLNAQQQADWLRGVGDGKTGRALARRAQQAAGDIDYQEQVQAAVRCISTLEFPESGSNIETIRSFFSWSEPMECLKAASELVDVVENLTLGDVLQCVGGVGVPFEAFVDNFPDPFTLRIKRVYDGQYLAEPDVWISMAQTTAQTKKLAGAGALTCPGRGDDAFITGVIALCCADEGAYRIYTRGEIRRIFELQASCQIRHVAAPVPYDAVALNAAGLWYFAQTFGQQKKLSSIQRKTLEGLLQNVSFLIGTVYKSEPFRDLYDSMAKNDDARPWLSGDRDVGDVLRPIAALLRFFDSSADGQSCANSSINMEWLPHVLRALYYLDCYHAAKRHFRRQDDPAGARERTIASMLKIDLEQHATPLRPLFEPEPCSPEHFDSVNIGDIVVPQFFPNLFGLIGLEGVLHHRDETTDPIAVFGVKPKILRVVAALQGLLSPNQSDRINTDRRISILPDPTTEADATEYLRGVVHGCYAEDYKRRAAEKKRQEERIQLTRAIDDMVLTGVGEEFRQLLLSSAIVNRQHEGYGLLMEQLLVTDKDIPCQLDKLSLLVTGRDVKEPDVAVWNKGNTCTGDWDSLAKVMKCLAGGEERMAMLFQIRKQYGIHSYRESSTNRHGHGNHFPSYWALGYKTIHAMKECVPQEEFAAYFQAHCEEKGCCLPKDIPI